MSPDTEIRIWKSRRVLELWEGGRLIRTFSIGIGRAALGPKRFEGDCRTPEGEYRVCVKNPKSRFHLSLGLDYPGIEDARLARIEGRIDVSTERAIVHAHEQGGRPPWNTPLGGEIYIHGGLENHPDSRGCVALTDADMERVFSRVPTGARVVIRP